MLMFSIWCGICYGVCCGLVSVYRLIIGVLSVVVRCMGLLLFDSSRLVVLISVLSLLSGKMLVSGMVCGFVCLYIVLISVCLFVLFVIVMLLNSGVMVVVVLLKCLVG